MKHKALFLVVILVISISIQACAAPQEEFSRTEPAQPSEAVPSSETESPSVWITLQSVQNARQLGGYSTQNNRVIRQDAILRTGELALLTEADKELLVNGYKLT